MTQRLLTIVLLVVVSCSLSGNSFAKHKKRPSSSSDTATADFDYFLLTLSWARPNFAPPIPTDVIPPNAIPRSTWGW